MTERKVQSRLTNKLKNYLSMSEKQKKRLKNDIRANNKSRLRDIVKVSLADISEIIYFSKRKRLKVIIKDKEIKCLERIIRQVSCLMDNKVRERLRLALEEGYIYNSTEEMKTRLLPTPEPRIDSSTLFKDRHMIRSKMGLDNRNLNKFLKEP